MKTCTRCKIPKDDNSFRLRTDKRYGYVFLNSWCRECEQELAIIYYNKVRNDPEFKRKNSERAKEYCKAHSEKVRFTQKKRRDKPENKKRRKQYDKENKVRIAALSKKRNLKYIHKIISKISDQYVIQNLKTEYTRKNGNCAGVVFDKNVILERKRRIALHHLNKILKILNNEEQNRRLAESFICSDGETQ